MRKLAPLVALAAFTLAFAADTDFKPLFNGKDFTNWHLLGATAGAPEPWIIKEGGIYACQPKTHGWLSSDKEYDNFHLKFEFRMSPKGNNGVWLRCPEQGRQSRLGWEYQIYDDGKPPHKGSTASVYDCIAPSKAAWKPVGEWNTAEVIANKSHVIHILNGEKVIDVDFDDPEVNAKLADDHKLSKRQRKGHIGLSNHNDPCEFRNFFIKEL